MMKRIGLWMGTLCAMIAVALALLLLVGGPVAAQTAVRIFGTLSGAAKAVAVDSTGRVRVVLEGGGGTFDAPVTVNVNSIGTTSTRGVSVDNSTAAAAGAQQYSPMVCQEGQGWKTNATAGSQSVEFCWEVQPVQGTSAPSGNYIIKRSINGGAFSTVGTFASDGNFTSGNHVFSGGNVYVGGGAGNGVIFAGGARSKILDTGADGVVRVANNDSSNTYDITLADWGTTVSAEGVSLANGSITFIGTNAKLGNLRIVTDQNFFCSYFLRGTTNGTVEVTDVGGACTITKDNASTYNIYYDAAGASGAGYYIQNNAATSTVRIVFEGV